MQFLSGFRMNYLMFVFCASKEVCAKNMVRLIHLFCSHILYLTFYCIAQKCKRLR